MHIKIWHSIWKGLPLYLRWTNKHGVYSLCFLQLLVSCSPFISPFFFPVLNLLSLFFEWLYFLLLYSIWSNEITFSMLHLLSLYLCLETICHICSEAFIYNVPLFLYAFIPFYNFFRATTQPGPHVMIISNT